MQLALEFKTWVEVDVARLETLRLLELPDVFSTEPGSGRLRVVAQSRITAANLHAWNKEHPTIAILPTSRPVVSCHPHVHVVPYSDHSSYQELEDFVSALRPISLLPIVGNCMPHFSSLLSARRKRHDVIVPESVQQYMKEKPCFQPGDFQLNRLLKRSLHPGPRGVVFESPGKQLRFDNGESDAVEVDDTALDSEAGEHSDCVLDMSADVTSRSPDLRVTSEAVPTNRIETMAAESTIITNNIFPDFIITDNNQDTRSSPGETTTPTVTSLNSDHSHYSSCNDCSSTVASSKTHLDSVSLPVNEIEAIEQWLLNNFIISEEELTGYCGTFEGLHKLYPLAPINNPQKEEDPFEAAILRLKSK